MGSPSENFVLERDGRKAILTFAREDRLNALDAQIFRDLLVTLKTVEADPEIGVLIITGRGRAFVAGADINGYIDRTVLEYVDFQRLGRLVYDRLDLPATSDCVERRCLAGQGTICCPPLGLDACGVVVHANLALLIEEEDRELARARGHEEPGSLDREARGSGRRGIADLAGGARPGRYADCRGR